MAKKTKVNIFQDMQEGMRDALAYERGETLNLRVTKLPAPPQAIPPKEIRRIRCSLHASQTLFADYLNVSPNAVRSWEQGVRRPQHATLKLLTIVKKNPKVLLQA
jgi:putative transcriptional regulator